TLGQARPAGAARRQARRSARRAARPAPLRHQCEDRQGARPRDPRICAGPRRRGRRVSGREESLTGDGPYGSRAAAEGWRRGAAQRAERRGLATETMLDLAGIVSGSRVLDVAAGTGEQTILAARRVGPGGSVLATDIAARMLGIAAEAAHQAGLRNVATR